MLGWQQGRRENSFATNWLGDSKSLTSQDFHFSTYDMTVGHGICCSVSVGYNRGLLPSEAGQSLKLTMAPVGWVQEVWSFPRSPQRGWIQVLPVLREHQCSLCIREGCRHPPEVSKPPASQNLLRCHLPNPSPPRRSHGILLLGLPASILAFLESTLYTATQKVLQDLSDH